MPTGIYKHKSPSVETIKKRVIKLTGLKRTEEQKIKMGIAQKNRNYSYSETSREKMRQAKLKNPTKYWLGKKRPDIEGEKNPAKREEVRIKLRGKNANSWKGGITPINIKIRSSIEMDLWRQSVFARDNWTDQKNGIKGGKLVAHHIQNFAQFPELRFAIDNGITFSEKTHKEFHKRYGRKNNTKEQLNEFLIN